MERDILIIGAAILDVLARPVSAEVFETGSFPAEDIQIATGGDALNEAVVLSGLGKKVRLETVIGGDMAGRIIVDYCKKCDIEIRQEAVHKELTTGVNIVLVKEDGERSFLTNPGGSLRKLTEQDIRIPFPKETKILCFASIFVFPEIRGDQMSRIFRSAKEQGITVCADMTKCKNGERVSDIAEALSLVDYIFPNQEEAFLVTGKEETEDAADALLDAGVKNVVIKCGAEGCLIKNKGQCLRIPAVKGVKAIDTTGAGDSFTAGFIYALSEGRTPEECGQFANECGAKAISVSGAVKWTE